MEKIMLNLNSLATMLCTCDLYAYDEAALTSDEWLEVEKNLKVHGLNGPSSLFGLNSDELMDILDISEYSAYKIVRRMKSIQFFLKKLHEYEQQGIRIITKYDEEYPQNLIKKMKKSAPLCLFIAGTLPVKFEGISITGLQTVSKKEKGYVKRLVDKINNEDKWLISNDCKGIDQEAFHYGLHHHSQIICFVCENMLNKIQEYKKSIRMGKVVFLSAVDPAKRFTVTHAIDRNSYVCALSMFQIVVSSKINSGATWFTIMHNMHHNWTVSLVLDNDCFGNQRLLEMKTVPIYIKNIVSDTSFEMIYELNKKENIEEVNIDQMSIFEFIGDTNESRIYKITYFLMAVNVITYLYTSLKYGLSMSAMQGIQVGGFNPLYVYYYHEYYRMITANFIHFGLMHIFCNVYSLYNLGMLMEKILKEKKYIIVIVVSMISTTLFSYLLFLLFNIGTNSVMGGISGVVFGLIGSLLALSVLYGDVYSYLFKQIVSSVVLMLFISVAVPSISLVGHLGGMIGGFVATFVLEKIDSKKERIIN